MLLWVGSKIIANLVCMLLFATALPSISGSVVKNANIGSIQNYEFVPGEFIIKFTEDTEILSPSIAELNEKYQVDSIEKIFENAGYKGCSEALL